MFTGLVSALGTVTSLTRSDSAITADGGSRRLMVRSPMFDGTITIGESIAVNGVCLTVAGQHSNEVVFQLAPETLRRSNLGGWQPGSRVNLERSLRLVDRLGGHWVQGHVDGVGTLLCREADADWERFVFQMPVELGRYMVEKGSITINGVSLTLVNVDSDSFSVALIPQTLAMTNLGLLHPKEQVNLEVDILAKYIEKLVGRNLR